MSYFTSFSSSFYWPFWTRPPQGQCYRQSPVKRLLIVLAALAVMAWLLRPAPTSNGPLTIEQVQALAELVTARIEVADVRQARIKGRVGGAQAILVVKGQILLGVDLNQAKLLNVNKASKTATLLLPQPRVTSVRLDHQRSRIVAMGPYGLWVMVPWRSKDAEVVNLAFTEAQQALEQAAADPELLGKARQHAQDVLGSFALDLSWQLNIQWMPAEGNGQH